ncbi:MAG: hypothetical protein DRI46_14040 [Chloroflexi bacterium]|nr:MAG: hypothetical protein DRI46_14040 [Chloroflexota bacterium]
MRTPVGYIQEKSACPSPGRVIAILGLSLLFLATSVCLFDSGAAAADFSFPKGFLGRAAADYIDAFNSGEDSLVAEFHTANFTETSFEIKSLNSRLYQYQSLHKMLGELEPYETVKKNKSKLVIRARSEKLGSWFEVGFEIDKSVPEKLSHHYIRPASKPKVQKATMSD